MPPSPLHSKTRVEDGVHTPIAFVYADETERLNAANFTDYDLYKFCLQLSSGNIYYLAQVSPPVWVALNDLFSVILDERVKTTYVDSVSGYLAEKITTDSTLNLSVSGSGGSPQSLLITAVPDTAVQKVTVQKNSTPIGDRSQLNLIEGSNVTLTVADNPTDNRVDITIAAGGGGGGTDEYVKVSATDTTAAHLNSKISVTGGLQKSITTPTGNEGLQFNLPTGSTNKLLRYNGTAWDNTSRIIDYGNTAGGTYGAVHIIGDSGDTAPAGLYVQAKNSSGAYALHVYGDQGRAINAEVAGIAGSAAIYSSAKGSVATHSIIASKDSNTNGTYFKTINTTSGSNHSFQLPASGGVRLYDDNAGTNYVGLNVPTSVTTAYTITLPAAPPAANGMALTSTTAGVASWSTVTAAAGGSNTQVQYNNSGVLGGIASFTWDGTTLANTSAISINASGTNTVNVGTGTHNGAINLGNNSQTSQQISIVGKNPLKVKGITSSNNAISTALGVYASPASGTNTDGFGTKIDFFGDTNTTADTQIGQVGFYYSTITHASRTSVFEVRNTTTGSITKILDASLGSLGLYATNNAKLTISPNGSTTAHTLILPATQGGANTFLKNDGSGNLTWASGATGTPAGSDTQIQFNQAGAFGASSNLLWTYSGTPRLTVTGEVYLNQASGGKAMVFGATGANQGGQITIPSSGSSSVTILGCTTAANGQGIGIVSGNGTGNGNGGAISILTGIEAGTGTGGNIILNTGGIAKSGYVAIATNSTSSNVSGSISLLTGQTSAGGDSGAISLITGDVATTGITGSISIQTGHGSASGAAGSISIGTGIASTGTASGVTIYTSAATTGNRSAGDINIGAGNASGTGTGGSIFLTPGANGSGGTYGKIVVGGNVGHRLAFFGGSGAAKGSAITQTYATTATTLTKINSAGDIGSLTIGGTYSQTQIQNLRDKTEDLATDVRVLTNVFNQLLDTLQSYNLI